MGEIDALPQAARTQVAYGCELTRNNTGMVLNIALNYGGRDELVRAAKALAQRVADGQLAPEQIDRTALEAQLYTHGLPDPDLLIRSSGELRLSNFLLWQVAYSEFWITDTYWPDFRAGDLYDAVYAYQKRDRRYGGLKK